MDLNPSSNAWFFKTQNGDFLFLVSILVAASVADYGLK
jgi:hypothetical protein